MDRYISNLSTNLGSSREDSAYNIGYFKGPDRIGETQEEAYLFDNCPLLVVVIAATLVFHH